MNILYHSPLPSDPSSFYRAAGPLSCLHHLDPTIHLTEWSGDLSWSTVAQHDLLFLHRPFSSAHAGLANLAKSLHIPLWIDYDDNVFEVPPCHGEVYKLYQSGPTQRNISAIMSQADMMTVATEQLADLYREWTPEVQVVPNAYNDYWLPHQPPSARREKAILWRGSPGHIENLVAHADALATVAAAHPDWQWVFMGPAPWPIRGRFPLAWHSGADIISYHHIVRDVIRPSILIQPLVNNPFNNCRSDNLSMEAASFGALAWRGLNCTELGQILTTLDPEHLVPDWAWYSKHRMLSTINQQRLAILEHLL